MFIHCCCSVNVIISPYSSHCIVLYYTVLYYYLIMHAFIINRKWPKKKKKVLRKVRHKTFRGEVRTYSVKPSLPRIRFFHVALNYFFFYIIMHKA